MIIKQKLYKITLSTIAIVLMLASTAGASTFGDLILKTNSATQSVDFLKFPVCGSEDKNCGCEDHIPCPPCQAPSLTITKLANVSHYSTTLDQILYTYTLNNTGNVNLTGIVLYDSVLAASGFPLNSLSITAPGETTLTPGDSATVYGIYNVTESDITTGYIYNSAHATAGTSDNSIQIASNTVYQNVTLAT